jgi:hypothetical protein
MTSFSRLLFLICGTVFVLSSVSQTPRTYKINDPESLQTVLKEVIEVQKTNNLQSSKFPEDFEIEVKNISKKPIYFIYIFAILPHKGTAFRLFYGDPQLMDIKNRPGPTDVPIKPGETGIVKPDDNVKYVRPYLEKKLGSDSVEAALSSIVLAFQTLSFGDGTGYIVGKAYPTNKVSQNVPGNKELVTKSSLASKIAANCDTFITFDGGKCIDPEIGCTVTQTRLASEADISGLCFCCVPCLTGCCNQDFLVACSAPCGDCP